ncbi:MAG TPA: VWA domain-containing protein, partial [Thermoanaerobaculia bacterium]|nr:VWA domain-containing protein [Thermoanaerobaculia bacterium]
RRHFLLLFDLTFSDPFALVRGRNAARGVLSELHPTDLVAVATYSQTGGVQMLVGFTPDRAQAAAAIDTLGLTKLFTPVNDPLRMVFTAPASARAIKVGRPGPGGEALDDADSKMLDTLKAVSTLTSGTQRSVDSLIVRNMTASFADLARVMGEVDGRKYVVLLSEGFNSSLLTGSGSYEAGNNDLNQMVAAAGSLDPISGTDMSQGADDTFGDSRTLNQLEKMLTELRRGDCQIQAVDIGGLRALAAEGRTDANGRESLLTMAKSTGGDLYENFNDLSSAMGQMLRRTGVTYVLTFQPGKLPADGEFQKLRVELKNARGARVVHRPGYYAPRAYGQQAPMLRALQTADAMMGEEGGAIASTVLAASYAGSGERAYVPLVVEVDGATLLGGKQGPQLPIEIYVYAIDEAGAVHDYRTQSLALDLAKAEAQLRQTGLKYFGHLSLPKGKFAVRTLVRNAATGATSLRVSEIEVPAFAGGEATLLPPLFPEPPGRWVMVRQALQEGEAQPPYPFMLGGAPFIPASRPVLAAGQPVDVVLQGYNLAAGDVTAKAEVLGVDGTPQPGGGLELGKQSGGTMRVVSGKFTSPQLQPGEYRLRVTVTDAAGKSATSTGAFTVGGGTVRAAAR